LGALSVGDIRKSIISSLLPSQNHYLRSYITPGKCVSNEFYKQEIEIMAKEIERKFIVDTNIWRPASPGDRIRQGYLPSSTKTVVRVRTSNDKAWLTVKGENKGMVRSEFEYPIPLADALLMLEELCVRPFIDKIRYSVNFRGEDWTVDVFEGDNAGLTIAEIEVASEDQNIILPPWAGAEVTDDPKYYNSSLITRPYCRW
jgi:adenylate cyclase